MKTFLFSLDDKKNGGKISAFNYSHSLNELAGSWSAAAAGGNFKAGNSISFDGVMENAIITRAYKNSEGLWHIEGYDAGVKLMKSTPDIQVLPLGNAKTVISALAETCGISLVMNDNGLEGFNVRSLISGSTCAEAVLELAMTSGLIAFINNKGQLVIQAPSDKTPDFENIIDDTASDIDLDGYADHVFITLNRRQADSSEQNTDNPDDEEIVYLGETPSHTPTEKSVSGTFSNGSYSVKTYEPLGVIKELSTTITDNGITIETNESHTYDVKHKIIWRDNQEYLLFAFIETGYSLTKTATGQFNGTVEYVQNGTSVTANNPTFSETTSEVMTRHFDNSYARIGIPNDWVGDLFFVDSENITRSTSRTGFIPPQDNMPPYSPPFDSHISKEFSRSNDGRTIICNEINETYEARQIGSVAPVTLNGQNIPHFMQGTNLAVQTHSTPQWVLIRKNSTILEKFNYEGQCIFSAKSDYSDDGALSLQNDNSDNSMDAFEAAYAAFTQNSNGLQVSMGSAGYSSHWQFLELQGRTKTTVKNSEKANAALANVDYWYDNGQYVRQSLCPHYNSEAKNCNIHLLYEPANEACLKFKGYNWGYCDRAIAALDLARAQDTPQLEAPVFASASENNSRNSVGYKRDFYIDEIISDEQALSIAQNIANNILAVKSNKGFRKTVTIPYCKDFLPDGTIVEVAHDWAALTTSVTYRDEGEIPDCLISQSVASVAAFVSARDNSRHNIPQYGKISEINNSVVKVNIGNSNVSCSSKFKSLSVGDIVLVSFPAGNKLRGQVIARL